VTNLITDPAITATNWTITNATVQSWGDIEAKSTGIPLIRSKNANVFTGTEGQQFTLDMSATANGLDEFVWRVRLVLASDFSVLAEQQIDTTSTTAVHLEYVVTAETAGQNIIIEIGTDTAPGSSSYYLSYTSSTFTLELADAPEEPEEPEAPPVVSSGVYRDRVGVSWTSGGTDHTATFPAVVWPLGTDYTVDNGPGGVVTSRYRMVLKPVVPIPAFGVTGLRFTWGEYTGTGALYVDGAVERHMLGGRLHHYEATTQAVAGG
jgi:hypothetical protein